MPSSALSFPWLVPVNIGIPVLFLMHYRYEANTDPAALMGDTILESLRLGEPTDDLEDILPCRYDEITLPMLGAALFERGWIHPNYRSIYPIDPLALGDIGYVTKAGKFVVVDNVFHRLQAKSGTLSWDGTLEFISGGKSLGDAPAEDIVSEGGNVYFRRRQVCSLFNYFLTVNYSRLCTPTIPAKIYIEAELHYQNLDQAHAYKLLQADAHSIVAHHCLPIAPHDLILGQFSHTFRTRF